MTDIKLNHKQRKFLSELADLMQKHNVNLSLPMVYGSIQECKWNIGGKEFGHVYGLKPSVIRGIIKKRAKSEE